MSGPTEVLHKDVDSLTFVTTSHMTCFLSRPFLGAFLFVLYAMGYFLCHRFMPIDYHADICEVT